MWRNYLKTILRQISRQKTFAFLNIFGLTIGLAGFILIYLFVRYELTYDSHHTRLERLYMIVRDVHMDNNVYNFTPVPYPFRDAIVATYPEIEKATRLDAWGKYLFSSGDKIFDEPVALADKELFDMFTFRFIEGGEKPFRDLSSVVISKKIAEKYFGSASAIGKTFTVNGQHSFTVSAVFDNFPPNSSMRFDIILPFDFHRKLGTDIESWSSNSVNVLLLLLRGTNVAEFQQKLEPKLAEYQPSDKPDKLFLHPLKDLHLHAFHYNGGPVQYVYIFSLIGFLILALAAINYVNLVTARSVRRMKEIGIRKTVGASKAQVVFQFLGESVVLSLVALNFAVLLIELLLPLINPVIGKELTLDYTNPVLVISLLIIAVITGLASGAYPAFVLGRFSPASVLKANAAGKGSFKSVLVIVQFAVSVALIITSVILYRQFVHLTTISTGFNRENIFLFKVEDQVKAQMEGLRKEFLQLSPVRTVSVSSHVPSEIYSNGGGFSWEGKDPAQDVLISFTEADDSYPETFDIKVLQGRFFRNGETVQDTVSNTLKIVINKRFAEILNFDPVGKVITNGSARYEIIGVVNDFNFQQMRASQAPLIIVYNPSGARYGFVRFHGNPSEVKSALEKSYTKLFPDFPPDFILLDDRYKRYFGSESQNAQLFGYFTILAIIISCLGLYGLATFVAEQRRKEMGIRKALGATTSGLSFLMMRDFAIWILVANVIAVPVAWYFSNQMLSKYVFRTEMSFGVFLAATLASFVIAGGTVIFQVLKGARQNPADVLKYE